MALRKVTRQFLVYCAGPITGLSWEDATAWYKIVEGRFPPYILPMRPLRGKGYLRKETKIAPEYTNLNPLSSAEGVLTRDKNDVRRADALLVNLLSAPENYSAGTIMEIAWGHLLDKPVIVAMTKDNVHFKHPMIRQSASIILPTIEEAIDVTISLISPI